MATAVVNGAGWFPITGTGTFSASAVDPNLTDYLKFLRGVVGIPVEALPDSSPWITQSYWYAMTVCNEQLGVVGNAETPPPQVFPTYYAYAVYNLGADFLVRFALDDPAAPPPWNTYWKDLRAKMGLNSWVPGVIQSSSDQGTSQSFMIPDWYRQISLGDQMLLQTPWGRQYLALAQAYGPTIWGLTP
jgi:hypothetical protein